MTEESPKPKKKKTELKTPTTFDSKKWEERRSKYFKDRKVRDSKKPEIIVQQVEEIVEEKPKKNKAGIMKVVKRSLIMAVPIGIILLYWRYKNARK